MAVKLYTDQTKAANKLAEVQQKVDTLQAVYDALISLGAEAVTLSDVKSVINADNPTVKIREIVLRGKTLTVGGMAIDTSFIQLPDQDVKALALMAKQTDPGRNMSWNFYGIEEGVISVLDIAEAAINERFSVYGSEAAQDVIEDVDALCVTLNAIMTELNVTGFHPMASVDSFLVRHGGSGQISFSPNIHKIAEYVK